MTRKRLSIFICSLLVTFLLVLPRTLRAVDLQLFTMTARAPTPTYVGNNIEYNLTIMNDAENSEPLITGFVTFNFTISVRLIGSSNSSDFSRSNLESDTSCSLDPRSDGKRITCALGSITFPDGAGILLVIQPVAEGSLSVTAELTSSLPQDSNTGNNFQSTRSIRVDPVPPLFTDLAVTMPVPAVPGPVAIGSNVTYTATVMNEAAGSATANGVNLRFNFSSAINLVSFNTNGRGNCTLSDRNVNCDIGTLANPSRQDVQITVSHQTMPSSSSYVIRASVSNSDPQEAQPDDNFFVTTARWTSTCGNSIIERGEACDDGNNVDSDSCISCMNSVCGDGFTRSGVEACDDGNDDDMDDCRNDCSLPECGNGELEDDELCDDSDDDDTDECRNNCMTPVCGDNLCNANETCNSCTGDCGVCSIDPICGNSIREEGEGCDDGNVAPGDGCDAACAVELPPPPPPPPPPNPGRSEIAPRRPPDQTFAFAPTRGGGGCTLIR